MPPLGEIAIMYWETLPTYFSRENAWVLLAVGGLISWQYARAQKMEIALFGRARYPLALRLMLSVLLGVVGGLVGSLLLTGVGVAISSQWIGRVMLCSLVLALIDMRLICFAYSGGLLSLSYLLFGWPEIDVASMLGMVAVLHLVESVLMLLSGHLGATAVYVRRDDRQMVGGYNLQMFWPLPLLALMFAPQALVGGGAGIAMPDWWPLIKPAGAPLTGDLTLFMVPLLAALGYGELAVTTSPRKKATGSAARLLLFSLTLLGLAWLGNRQPVWLWAGAIFSPLGHELLIVFGNWREQTGKPLWQHTGRGVMVMEVLAGGWGQAAGLRPRDVILAVNEQPLSGLAAWEEQLEAADPTESGDAMARRPHHLTVQRGKNQPFTVQLPAGAGESGLLLVPDMDVPNYVEARFRSPLLWLWRKFAER